jgi:hypothetical protein
MSVETLSPTTSLDTPRRKILDQTFFWIILAGWVGYVIAAPVYIFDTGLPQPADLLIFFVSSIAIGLFLIKKKLFFNRVFVLLILMVGLFCAINFAFASAYGDAVFYYSSAYYFFNAMAFGTTVILFKDDPDRMFTFARFAFLTAIFFELSWVLMFDSKVPFRETGSFLNPNQLGYWALLASAVIVMLNYGRRMPVIDMIALLVCAFMIAESLSRAAMISFILIIISVFLGRNISFLYKVGLGIVFFLYVLIKITTISNEYNADIDLSMTDRIIQRLDISGAGSDPTKYSERGYERLIENPGYLITGSGEGAYWRFMPEAVVTGYSGLEIHSGLATILFSYGIFGFFLFCLFVFSVFQKAPWLAYFSLAAVMAYGLTHQHIRFSGFWIYLGIVYGVSRYVLNKNLKSHSDETP